MSEGLHQKYSVVHLGADGLPDYKHAFCEYFVLDLACDPHARVAARAYAESIAPTNPELARDLADLASRSSVAGDPQ